MIWNRNEKENEVINEKSIDSVDVDSSEEGVTVNVDHDLKDMVKAAAYASTQGEPIPPGMDRRLQIKADIFITSFMGLVCGAQFADRTLNSAGTAMYLREDLGMMTGSGYNWTGSAYYLGYLVFIFPMSYLLMKMPLAKTTGTMIAVWGVTIACSAACKNMESFLALRTLLGVLESSVMPTYVVLTSQYYKRNQQYSRTLCWIAMNGFGTILSNVLGVGLLNRKSLPMHGWRLLYIIMGVVSIVLGVLFIFHMPNSPAEAWFYTEEEKKWQVERIRENKQGYGSNKVKWYQIKETFLDVHTYLYCAAVLCTNVPNGAISTMLNLILADFNYTKKESLLMALPCGGTEIVGLLSTAVVSSYILPNHRMIWSCFMSAASLMCLCLVAWGPNSGSQLAGIYIWYWVNSTSYVGLISCIESNSAGHTKKLTTNAIFNVFFCVGNLIGPLTFKSSEAPAYPTGKTVMAVCSAIQFSLEFSIIVSYIIRNRLRDRENKHLPSDMVNSEFADLTDMENPEFRYAL